MHVPDFLEMTLLLTDLDAEKGTVVVTYRPPAAAPAREQEQDIPETGEDNNKNKDDYLHIHFPLHRWFARDR